VAVDGWAVTWYSEEGTGRGPNFVLIDVALLRLESKGLSPIILSDEEAHFSTFYDRQATVKQCVWAKAAV